MKPLRFLFSILLSMIALSQLAWADSAVQHAVAFAEALQEEAAVSVVVARDRVAEAESTLRIAQSAADYAGRANDREAMAVAAKAVSEGKQHLREAEQFLSRAKALLATRVRTSEQLREITRGSTSTKAVAVPIESEVRQVSRGGDVHSNLSSWLEAGDRIETGPNGKARLFVAGGDGDVELSKNSSFTIMNDSAEVFQGDLERGIAHLTHKLKVFMINKFAKFEVRTPSAVLGVRGTDFTVEVLSDGTRVQVYEGIVSVTPSVGGDPVDVFAGTQRRYVNGQGFLPAEPLDAPAKQHSWSADAPAR
jgi:ferric-dicitrate binding protein FerR (iron transport regulator)